MASFWESIDALKEAVLALLGNFWNYVRLSRRQMDTKTSKNIKFGHELPAKDNNINELWKKSPPMASKNPKKLAESGKINKNLFF